MRTTPSRCLLGRTHSRLLLAALSLAVVAGGCLPPEEAPADEPGDETEQALASDKLVNFQPTYIGVYRPGGGSLHKKLGLDKASFEGALRDLANLGGPHHLASIATHRMGSSLRYTGLWLAGGRDQRFLLGRNDSQFPTEYTNLTNEGYRLVAIAATPVGTTTYYSGIFERGGGAHTPRLNRTRSQFDSDRSSFRGQGRRLSCLTTHVINGEVRYSGVWVPSGLDQDVVMDLQAGPFQQEVERQRGLGRYLSVVSTQVRTDVVRHTGLFNNSGGHAWISFGQWVVDFENTESGERSRGSILGQIQISHVEGLALNRLVTNARNAFGGITVGVASAARSGSQSATAATGKRRTANNPPERDASATARTNSASVTKTATAIAALQLLAQRGLNIDATVQQFLPSDWRGGNNIDTLTFRHLLTHRSGFKQANNNPSDFLDYNNLRSMVLAGRGAGAHEAQYFNSNFALFRIIIPFMAGTVTDSTADKPTATANAYLSYMNSRVFAPAEVAATTSRPAATEPTLHYPPAPTSASGVTQGDLTLQTAGGFLELSADDIAKMLRRRADGTLLTQNWRDVMDANGMGWDETQRLVRHGFMKWKGGFIPCNWAAAGCAVNTMAATFPGDVHYGQVINSGVNVNILFTVIDAYNRAWVPTY